MKHIKKELLTAFLAFILFSLVLPANSEPVTQGMAQQVAQAFLLKEQAAPPMTTTKVHGELVVQDQAVGLSLGNIRPIADENNLVLAYVQEIVPEGFIITSADDGVRPVLGFSTTGTFSLDERNPLLRLIIADTKARLRMISELENEAKDLVADNVSKWNPAPQLIPQQSIALESTAATTQWGPYISTYWRQSGHYNNECPVDPSSTILHLRSLVGCVAVSLGQVVNYWQYPMSITFDATNDRYLSRGKNGSFWIPDTATSQNYPDFTELESALANISYSGDNDEEAYLLFGLGVKVKMSYSKGSSSASHYRARAALEDELGFGSAKSMNIRIFNRDGELVENRWNEARQIIVENMKSGFPVILGVEDVHTPYPSLFSGGNHSIVADGYRESDGYFHLNMGWGSPQSPVWYDLPDFTVILPQPADYDVVDDMIYEICPGGWNQLGGDQRNRYHSIYSSPIATPVRKWVTDAPPELPTSYSMDHLVVGTGGRIYASLGPSLLGGEYHPYIVIYDKFGTREKLIEITESNTQIAYLCQNSRGEVFFGSDQGGPTKTDSRLFRLNPKTDEVTTILTHTSPDTGIFEQPIKVDRDDYLYFVIQPRWEENYSKFYAVSRTGSKKWTEKSFPVSAEFHKSVPVIDEDRDRVYLNYFEKTEAYKGQSRLVAYKRSDGAQVFDIVLPNIPTHYSSGMVAAPSIGDDGTIYIGAYNRRYAYTPNGTKLWEQSSSPAYANKTAAIGNDGTLYVKYGVEDGATWEQGVAAVDPSNGNTKWSKALTFGDYDSIGEIYSAANGMVTYSYVQNDVARMGGVKDDGSSYSGSWDIAGGGTLAFGPGRTIFSIPPGQASIWALSDFGERGDPEGLGMDYANNVQPFVPSLPSPTDGAVNQSTTSVQLSWACSDPDGHDLTYDIYACALVDEEEAAFVPLASQILGNSYTVTNLLEGTQYLWTVVASDGQAFANGPTWSFSTQTNPTYALIVNNGSGSGSYTNGQQVVITAATSNGYEFVQWTGDVAYLDDSNATPTTVTMPALNIAVTGTYVSVDSPIHYVDINNANPVSPYASWATAATNIQHAVDDAVSGDAVLVADGTYLLTSEIVVTTDIRIESVNGPDLTIVDGQSSSRCFDLESNDCEVVGFTIQHGFSPTTGGGVFCLDRSPSIVSCTVINNSVSNSVLGWAYGYGGGVHGGTLSNCRIISNEVQISTGFDVVEGIEGTSTADGGGLYNSATINCIISDNRTLAYSGGSLLSRATASGGGLSDCSATNCLIKGNNCYASTSDAGMSSFGGGSYGGSVVNCTVIDNKVTVPAPEVPFLNPAIGGGVYSSITHNSILFNNISEGGSEMPVPNIFGTANNSCSPDGIMPGVNGNTTNSPLFVDELNNDYHLLSTSPCINWGNNDCVVGTTDLDGANRVVEGHVDMGCYEYQGILGLTDSDNDGLLDSWEREHFGGNADPNRDDDNDGHVNWQEQLTGMDPMDYLSVFAITNYDPAASFVIEWPCVSNRYYSVYWSTNLLEGFHLLESDIEYPQNSCTDTVFRISPCVFYKVNVSMQPMGGGVPDDMLLLVADTNNVVDSIYGSYDLEMDHDFYMDTTLVTSSLWYEVYNWASTNGYEISANGVADGADHPIVQINWFDCAKWCNARSEMLNRTPCYTNAAGDTYKTGEFEAGVDENANGFRLPTHEEWEYAARGGHSSYIYPWGDTISSANANYGYNVGGTTAVTNYPPNDFGLYDMAGNVWEWCNDEYTPGERARAGGGFSSTTQSLHCGYSRDVQADGPIAQRWHIGFRTICRP